jgi:hypothetical protein
MSLRMNEGAKRIGESLALVTMMTALWWFGLMYRLFPLKGSDTIQSQMKIFLVVDGIFWFAEIVGLLRLRGGRRDALNGVTTFAFFSSIALVLLWIDYFLQNVVVPFFMALL